MPYLLVDEVLIIILDGEFPLHFLDFTALYVYLVLSVKHLFPCQFALAHISNQLPGILQFFPETPQLFGTLGISPAGLPNLANLASTETNIRVGVIGILTGFKLRKSAHMPVELLGDGCLPSDSAVTSGFQLSFASISSGHRCLLRNALQTPLRLHPLTAPSQRMIKLEGYLRRQTVDAFEPSLRKST